jgi:hypothetical protein
MVRKVGVDRSPHPGSGGPSTNAGRKIKKSSRVCVKGPAPVPGKIGRKGDVVVEGSRGIFVSGSRVKDVMRYDTKEGMDTFQQETPESANLQLGVAPARERKRGTISVEQERQDGRSRSKEICRTPFDLVIMQKSSHTREDAVKASASSKGEGDRPRTSRGALSAGRPVVSVGRVPVAVTFTTSVTRGTGICLSICWCRRCARAGGLFILLSLGSIPLLS